MIRPFVLSLILAACVSLGPIRCPSFAEDLSYQLSPGSTVTTASGQTESLSGIFTLKLSGVASDGWATFAIPYFRFWSNSVLREGVGGYLYAKPDGTFGNRSGGYWPFGQMTFLIDDPFWSNPCRTINCSGINWTGLVTRPTALCGMQGSEVMAHGVWGSPWNSPAADGVSVRFDAVLVPEPSSLIAMLSGIAGLAVLRRRRN